MRQHNREKADRLRRGDPRRQTIEPVAEHRPDRADVAGRLARHPGPQQRTDHARRTRESLLREQIAPRRADPRVVVVDLQQHRARRAQVGVERVVLLLFGGHSALAASLTVRSPCFSASIPRAAWPRPRARGVSWATTACSSATSGSSSARSRDKVGFGEIVGLQRRVDVVERGARGVERLARRVLAGGVRRRADAIRTAREQAQDAEDGQITPRGNDSAAATLPLASDHGRPVAATHESEANAPSVHLGTGKGLRPRARLC